MSWRRDDLIASIRLLSEGRIDDNQLRAICMEEVGFPMLALMTNRDLVRVLNRVRVDVLGWDAVGRGAGAAA